MPGDTGGDDAGDGATSVTDESGDADGSGASVGWRAREVEVPLSLYKIVVVFSTLIAGICVVGGFLALDAATRRARAPPSEIDPWLALLGLGLIAVGGLVYAFSGRFRAAGMETAKGAPAERSDDG